MAACYFGKQKYNQCRIILHKSNFLFWLFVFFEEGGGAYDLIYTHNFFLEVGLQSPSRLEGKRRNAEKDSCFSIQFILCVILEAE